MIFSPNELGLAVEAAAFFKKKVRLTVPWGQGPLLTRHWKASIVSLASSATVIEVSVQPSIGAAVPLMSSKVSHW